MKKTMLHAFGIILFLPPLAMAGNYKMIDDTFDIPQTDGMSTVVKHAEVCMAFLKNLEASPSYPPMACDVTFRPEFADFKTPEWKEIDVWENKDLSLQFFSPPKDEAEKERRLANLKELIKSGMQTYRTARFDIDNDGIPDQVLAVIDRNCDARKYANEMGWRYYVVYDPVSREVDTKKEAFYNGGLPYWTDASLFSYKGITYYASFGGTTEEPYFGKNDHATKYYIRLYQPLPMEIGLRTTWKQPAAVGCKYLYLPAKHEGGR